MSAVAETIIAILNTMTPANLDALPPARRRQFADLCRHWALIAERPESPPASGVLFQINTGAPRHE